MSRGFVKEDDQEEIPIVPPRADLPDGVTNYVTQQGLDELHAEQKSLIYQRDHLETADESERRITFNHLNAILVLLNNRISTAQVVDLKKQPQNEVRFGATVALKIGAEPNVQHYQIVGVDEADISKHKISFISPIARLLTNKKVGDKPVLKLTHEDRVFEIKDILYK
jgi:transcription elongation factor GreB